MWKQKVRWRPVLLVLLFTMTAACGDPPSGEGTADCEDLDERSSCAGEDECQWVVNDCDGDVRAGCRDDDEDILADGCQALAPEQCYGQEMETCSRDVCAGPSPGCSGEGDWIELDGQTCLTGFGCHQDDADECPDDFSCHPFDYDPCAGSDCDACGAIGYACFPDDKY